MSAACVILAAGASTRLGHPKQLVQLEGETLLDRAVRVAKEAGCSPVIAVLGAAAEVILTECALDDVQIVTNFEWPKGMGGSIRAGISALPEQVSAAVVMTCDQPAVDAAHLRTLIDSCCSRPVEQATPIASRYAGRNGVPACFPAAMFRGLMQLEGDHGASRLLENAPWRALPEGDLDVDTPESLARARQMFGDEG